MKVVRVIDGINKGERVKERLFAQRKLVEVVVEGPVGRVRARCGTSYWTSNRPALIPRTSGKPERHCDGGRGAEKEGKSEKSEMQERKERIAWPKPCQIMERERHDLATMRLMSSRRTGDVTVEFILAADH